MTLPIGSVLGDYRILARIGAGGYAEVFEAEHVITKRVEALKILTAGRPTTAEDEQRFLREIQVQASLHHRNIAAVHNAFSTSAGVVLVMERVPGEPLRNILDRGRIPLAQGTGYVLETLAALVYAELCGVIHRDIKPENIMITSNGSVKLTDFGLAQSLTSPRLTQAGTFAGSPCYMSPEQALAMGPVDHRSDIYSTGVVLYEVMTGHPPFTDRNGYAVMFAHQNTPPTPPIELEPGIGPELNGVILKALEKEPAQRFQSALEFHTALKDAVAPVPQRAAAAPYQGRRLYAGAAGMLAVIAAAGGSTMYLRQRQAAPATLPVAVQAAPLAPAPAELAPPVVEPTQPAAVARHAHVRPTPDVVARAPEQPAAACAAPAAASAAQCGVQASPVPVEESVPEAPADEPAPKKRNVVVRSLGKVFGKFKHKP